jgi:hypothetical protein
MRDTPRDREYPGARTVPCHLSRAVSFSCFSYGKPSSDIGRKDGQEALDEFGFGIRELVSIGGWLIAVIASFLTFAPLDHSYHLPEREGDRLGPGDETGNKHRMKLSDALRTTNRIDPLRILSIPAGKTWKTVAFFVFSAGSKKPGPRWARTGTSFSWRNRHEILEPGLAASLEEDSSRLGHPLFKEGKSHETPHLVECRRAVRPDWD